MKRVKRNILIFLAVMVAVFGIAAAVVFGIKAINNKTDVAEGEPEAVAAEEPEPEPKFELIDFQDVIDAWAKTLSSTKVSVMMYDFDNEAYVGEKNVDASFNSASLYKLPSVYAGYLMRETGEIDGDAILTSNWTFSECLDKAVRSSNSVCGEAVRNFIGAEQLSRSLTEWEMESTDLYNILTTASDMIKLLKVMHEHEGLSEETWAEIQDSMLNQPPSEGWCSGGICDWRSGLPSGFTDAVKVYDKVGWLAGESGWNLYHDVAILEFPSGRQYAIAVLTSGVTPLQIRDLAGKIEEKVAE